MPDEPIVTVDAAPTLGALLAGGEAGLSPALIRALPEPWRFRKLPPEAYDLSDPGLVTAVKAALLLGQPLILAGEPGVGKTTLAAALAGRLGLPLLPAVQVKSTSGGLDLFYQFDEVARFRDEDRGRGLRDYVRFSSLGLAILRSAGPATVVTTGSVDAAAILGELPKGPLTLGRLFPAAFTDDPVAARSIVLLDEMDKAPRDAPNDILGELEAMAFTIRELDIRIGAAQPHWPVLLITTNSERSLPDAFLRRCVFYSIAFPDDDRLRRIAATHGAKDWGLAAGDALVTSAIAFFKDVRDKAENKKPATAEFISFVVTLLHFGLDPKQAIDRADPRVMQAIGVLAKTKVDTENVQADAPQQRG